MREGGEIHRFFAEMQMENVLLAIQVMADACMCELCARGRGELSTFAAMQTEDSSRIHSYRLLAITAGVLLRCGWVGGSGAEHS